MKRFVLALLVLSSLSLVAQVDFQPSFFQIDSILYPDMSANHIISFNRLGDLDNDGDADAIIYGKDRFGSNVEFLWLLENQGGSQFVPIPDSLDFKTDVPPLIVDLNQDGLNDILSFKSPYWNTSNNVSVALINQGNFVFQPIVLNSLDSIKVKMYETLDVNNDGYPDLVLNGEHSNGSQGYTAIYINDSTGNFLTNEIYLGIYQNPAIGILDKNSDGFDDLVITGFNASLSVSNNFYLNSNNGGFTSTSFENSGFYSNTRIFIDDFDQDNELDFVVSNTNSYRKLNLYLNNAPQAGFTEDNSIFGMGAQGYNEHTHLVLDIDADGDNEVIAQMAFNSGGDTIKYYDRAANGNFQVMTNTNPVDLKELWQYDTVDINGDGYTDIYNSHGEELLYNNQNGGFVRPKQFNTFTGSIHEFRTLDFNQDGYDDFLLSSSQKNTSGLYLNHNGNFFKRQNIPFFNQYYIKSIDVLDIDGDGDLDFVGQADGAFILINNGNGQFTNQVNPMVDTQKGVFIMNLDGQHQLDIMMVERPNGAYHYELKFYSTDASGNLFLESITGLPDLSVYSTLAVGDINNDGLDDVYL
ncbi:FG-GAP repeat domain-containing protein [Croceimicrobium sp.]|uniref:FG-GAP repeat domain-containing protein n=1 Tax=Croceimicrobium sp. TaxID=2828340 RepID=UPI003BAA1E3E